MSMYTATTMILSIWEAKISQKDNIKVKKAFSINWKKSFLQVLKKQANTMELHVLSLMVFMITSTYMKFNSRRNSLVKSGMDLVLKIYLIKSILPDLCTHIDICWVLSQQLVKCRSFCTVEIGMQLFHMSILKKESNYLIYTRFKQCKNQFIQESLVYW